MESSAAGGWYPDPTGRFELRYHNGRDWTADVASDGTRFVDPSGAQAGRTQRSGTGAKNRLATAALVLGIVAVGIGWLPFVFVIGVLAAVLALVFGAIGRRRSETSGTGRGFANAGLVLGCVALAVGVIGFALTRSFVDAIDSYQQPALHEAEIVTCAHDGSSHTAEFVITNLADAPAEFAVRIEFVRAGTDNVQRDVVVSVDEIAPGETVRSSVSRRLDIDDVDCAIREVHGPLPFGVDPGI